MAPIKIRTTLDNRGRIGTDNEKSTFYARLLRANTRMDREHLTGVKKVPEKKF